LLKKDKTPVVLGGKIDNLLGANTSFKGTLKADGNLRIDGIYQGQIETTGNVIIGPSARVLADITANAVQVWGAVRGNIVTQGRLEILPNGRVWGDVRVASLLIDEWGMFRGQCLMAGEDVPPAMLLESGDVQPAVEPTTVAPAESAPKD
jgi:cytoskeletal protein CcmA (bactofilin family)